VKAVVLAAGEGTRLKPITSTRPKHLIKIGGKTLLEYCLNALKKTGIKEVLIVTHYMSEAIRKYFGNGEKIGLKIGYIEQEAVLGTGNAISIAEPYIEEDFVVSYGDLIFSADVLEKVVSFHKEEKPAATISVVPVKNPENYGIVELENGHVKRIIEKPSRNETPTNLANAGLYVFSAKIFEKIKQTKVSVRGEWEITDAISLMSREETVLGIKIPRNEWLDIGRPWDLLEANRWILLRKEHKVLGIVENGAHLIGPISVAETAHIRSGAYIEGPAFIDEESDIGPNCYIRPYTSIGKKVRIGNACEIKNSIIMDNTHIGHLSYVGDSIVGENCNLGAGTITANYRLDAKTIKMKIKDKVVDSKRTKLGTVLGDNVKAGINTLFMPGVKIGCNSQIGPNVIVYRDLPANTITMLKQNLEQKDLKL